jgi:Ni,Fe-hydrogenase I small subunit
VSAAAATLGLTQFELQKAIEALAKDDTPYKVVWLSGQACTGCTMAFSDLMSTGPLASTGNSGVDYSDPFAVPDYYDLGTIDNLAIANVINHQPGDTIDDVLLDVIDLDYHETLSAAAGDLAMDLVRPWRAPGGTGSLEPVVLVVEGAIPVTGNDAWGRPTVGERACTVGTVPASIDDAPDSRAGQEISIREAVINLATNAKAVVAVGNCASYGGIPAAYSDVANQWTGTSLCNAKGVQGAVSPTLTLNFWGSGLTNDKLINVPGCPPHPDWMYGTVVRIILQLNNILTLTVDSDGRPNPYYSEILHAPGKCPRYQDYSDGFLAVKLGDKGCLASIGCYGMSTRSDCAKRGWNNTRVNLSWKQFCIEAGHPCIGCTEKGYPFRINGG